MSRGGRPSACAFLLAGALSMGGCGQPPQHWEQHVSRHYSFTVLKPPGWKVSEVYQEQPRLWGFSVSDPEGSALASSVHGSIPSKDPADQIRKVVADLARDTRDFRLAPTARRQDLPQTDAVGRRMGTKTLVLFEGTFSDRQGRPREFRSLVSAGGGWCLHQRIEAPQGRLTASAPVLLRILANLRVAKGLLPTDEARDWTSRGARNASPVPDLQPQTLASGWAHLSIPRGWQVADLGKGSCLATDPGKTLFVLVAGAEFVAPRYFRPGVPGVLASEFRSPSDAYAFSAERTGRASDFQFQFVKPRQDLMATMRSFAGPLRPVAVEDFGYTCKIRGRPYQGFSTGGCSGDAMRASWRLWHFTLMAPAEAFNGALPTLAAILGSYQLNREMAGRAMADNLRNYYAGLRDLSQQIARNSEQMRRENLELHMEKGRVQDYVSYQTTRMIMGEYDYLAGASGYVRGDPSGLYTPEGTRITSDPYGGGITRNMQEINSRQLFEAARPH